MQELHGKTAIVTGGARGIGLAIAAALVEAGVTVFLAARNVADLDKAAVDLNHRAGSRLAVAVGCDVTRQPDVERLFQTALDARHGVDILVCNAGINPHRTRGIEAMEVGDWNAVMETNLGSAFLCCRAALPIMRAAGRGRIIFVNSIAGYMTPDGLSPAYRASKHALRSLATALAKDLAGTAIRVSSIMPGTTATRMVTKGAGDEAQWLRPADVADAALFLISRPDHVVVPEIRISPCCEIVGGSSPYL